MISRLRALFSKKEFTLEPVDLNEATREVIALFLSDLQRNRVILRSELADDLPPVTGDRVQLQQVILNLLRNVSDAMGSVDDRLRELLIRTERGEGDRVRLSVKDAGVGLPPQGADKLFEAFFTTKSDGMGIGLSISRSIIEAHRGHLWAAANDRPGATFSFAIPCRLEGLAGAETRVNRIDPATNAARSGPLLMSEQKQYQSTMDARYRVAHCSVMESHQGIATERRLLSVVDDDESVRESLPDLLREFGFAARAFSSAEEFLSSDSVDQTKCLILDVAMPGMTGLDLQQELRRRGQNIPVIFITAQKDEATREQALKEGAVNFLYKPFSDTALLEALNAAVPKN